MSVNGLIQPSFNLSASLFHWHTWHYTQPETQHRAALSLQHTHTLTHAYVHRLSVSMLRSGFIQLLPPFSDCTLAKVDKFENCFAALILKYLDNRAGQRVALKPASVGSDVFALKPKCVVQIRLKPRWVGESDWTEPVNPLVPLSDRGWKSSDSETPFCRKRIFVSDFKIESPFSITMPRLCDVR